MRSFIIALTVCCISPACVRLQPDALSERIKADSVEVEKEPSEVEMRTSRLAAIIERDLEKLRAERANSKKRAVGRDAMFGSIVLEDDVLLYEGLPHHFSEADLLSEELHNKKTTTFHGYPFYAEAREMTPKDLDRLRDIFKNPANFKDFTGEKWCGGFHPDYAIEWRAARERYRALICFGCSEILIESRGVQIHCDPTAEAHSKLWEILSPYRKNRPERKKNSDD